MAPRRATIERRRIMVQGIVQGVGFRPFVYGQALRYGLVGFVQNDSAGVTIEVEGALVDLDRFQQALREQAPPLAMIERISAEQLPTCGDQAFVIAQSHAGAERRTLISPDTATCAACLGEVFDPSDRRYRYPFTNCTNCGPRFTIVQDVPYDRALTTMRSFVMCPACRAEYDDPCDRRFHAQPNACPVCGPQVVFWAKVDMRYQFQAAGDAAMQAASALLAGGGILAVKGLGGYHLACDALNHAAVACLRGRKRREAKPFALMVADIAIARRLCVVDDVAAALLQAHQRPIVLLPQRSDGLLAPAVAPGYDTLGLMLPYTPLHHVLLYDLACRQGPDRPSVLVMTSGNVSDEPIAYRDGEAQHRLVGIADAVLDHQRSIHMRCDDTVVQFADGAPQFLRRSRGYVPTPIGLAFETPLPLLACGGHFKNTFCLLKGQQAFMGQHVGDLENVETLASFHEGIAHFQRLFDCAPAAVAYDLHPDYLATKAALALDVSHKVGVQHHHAHIASVLAEHGLTTPVIGVAADGTGYGLDGAIWGCEVLISELGGFERCAHLRYMSLPGGEQAIRQPWRVAAAALGRIYGEDLATLAIPFTQNLDLARWRMLAQMIARGVNSPQTSSLGRLFDLVAALIGLRQVVCYEGQAAIELECAARCAAQDVDVQRPYPFTITEQYPAQIDIDPMLCALVEDLRDAVPMAQMARRFHQTVAAFLAQACLQVRDAVGITTVALSGGVFQNRLLLEELSALLRAYGFHVITNRRVPPNDGGLSLGQAAVAATILRNRVS